MTTHSFALIGPDGPESFHPTIKSAVKAWSARMGECWVEDEKGTRVCGLGSGWLGIANEIIHADLGETDIERLRRLA